MTVEPGNLKNFINEAINIREGAIEVLNEQWLKESLCIRPPDLMKVAISAIDNAIGSTLSLFSNRYPETIVDTKVTLGEDGIKNVQVVVSDELSKFYFDQVSS